MMAKTFDKDDVNEIYRILTERIVDDDEEEITDGGDHSREEAEETPASPEMEIESHGEKSEEESPVPTGVSPDSAAEDGDAEDDDEDDVASVPELPDVPQRESGADDFSWGPEENASLPETAEADTVTEEKAAVDAEEVLEPAVSGAGNEPEPGELEETMRLASGILEEQTAEIEQFIEQDASGADVDVPADEETPATEIPENNGETTSKKEKFAEETEGSVSLPQEESGEKNTCEQSVPETPLPVLEPVLFTENNGSTTLKGEKTDMENTNKTWKVSVREDYVDVSCGEMRLALMRGSRNTIKLGGTTFVMDGDSFAFTGE